MAVNSRTTKPAEREVLSAEVVRTCRLTPHTVRVTIGGDELRRFRPVGFDQWFRLFLPREGQRELRRPDSFGVAGYLHYLSMPKKARPVVRNYTVRAYRPEPAEIDIDVLTHEGGFASAWARRVAPGGPVAILDEGTMYAPPTDTSWTLLACDESGLPAMANILAGMPRDARGEAYLEIPEPADAQELDPPAGMRVHWLNRAGSGQARAGELMRAAVTAADLPAAGQSYAFVVGEQSVVSAVRKHLLNERGLPKQRIGFCGYWRYRPSANGAHGHSS
ncbi:MAG: siderophore-interacting protein [Frankia sp.]|nr:siderophore-interacting protein [Frankia sp.]